MLLKKKNKKDSYTYRIIWSELDKEYIGLCDGFPSLSWFAKTQDDAMDGIKSIVYTVVKDIQSLEEKGK